MAKRQKKPELKFIITDPNPPEVWELYLIDLFTYKIAKERGLEYKRKYRQNIE